MNSEFYELIGKSINCLSTAKTDIINRKSLILEATGYIKQSIDKFIKEDPILNIDLIDLVKYNISNNNTNGIETTKGINQALLDAKEQGYKKVKLPPGHYSIDSSVITNIDLDDGGITMIWDGSKPFIWNAKLNGIVIPSDIEFIIEGCILEQVPCSNPLSHIVNFIHCKNSKIIGGTIVGDKLTHDYGMRLKDAGYLFKPGFINEETGLEEEIEGNQDIIPDYIDTHADWFSKEKSKLPNEMAIVPLWHTYFNSVDGGKKRIYCYDENDNFLGITGNRALCDVFKLLEGTAKIRIRIFNENTSNNDYTTNEYALTTEKIYHTHEGGSCIFIGDADNIEVNNVTIKYGTGDCIGTMAPPLKLYANNVKILNCDLYGSRRQGISLVSSGDNYLIQNCKIHHIGGIDPQFGIDIEHYEYVTNVRIDGCNFFNNRKGDIDNYNGTENIEITNCKFNSTVCSIYSPKKVVHDCTFEWHEGIDDDNKRDKGGGSLSLTDNDIAYNNTFINSSIYGSGLTYGNTFDGCNVTISSLKDLSLPRDKYKNSSVTFSPNDNFSYYNDGYFENCKVGENNNSKVLTIENSVFEDSNYWCSNQTTMNNCTFNMKTKALCQGWHVGHAKWVLNDCIINADEYEERILCSNKDSLNLVVEFNNCTFNLYRNTLALYYGSGITFNNCKFIFNDKNTSENRVVLNQSGYGHVKCPWYFNDCYFESEYPIEIYNSKLVVNPTLVGDIKLS